jgi:hypothetical protein
MYPLVHILTQSRGNSIARRVPHAPVLSVDLLRTLIVEAKSHQLKTGDGLDFCHAVMGSSFARVAALDKHWKRRVHNLPNPNGLACIYYSKELDKMVTDIESWVKQQHGATA